MGVELAVFLADFISCRLKTLVHPAVDFDLALSFTLVFEIGHTFEHLLTDLERSLEIILELYMVRGFFSSQQLCQLCFALLKVRDLSLLQICETRTNKVLLDQ